MAMLFGKKQKKTPATPLSASMGSSVSAPVVSGPIFHSSGSSSNVSEPEREHNYTRNYEVKTEALKIALQNSVHQTLSLRDQIKGLNNTLDDEVQQRKRAEAEVDELQQMLDVLKSRVRGLERQFQDEKANQQKLLSAVSSSGSDSASASVDSKTLANNPASIDLLRHTLVSNSQSSSSSAPSSPRSQSPSSPSSPSSSLAGASSRNERSPLPSGSTQTDPKPSLASTLSGSGLTPSAAAASLRKRPPVKSAILNTPTIRNRRPEDETGSPSSSPSSSSSNLNPSLLSHQSSSSLMAPAPSSSSSGVSSPEPGDQPDVSPRSGPARPAPPQRRGGERPGPPAGGRGGGGQPPRDQEAQKSPIDKLAQRQANRATVEVNPQSATKKHFPPPPAAAPPEHLKNKRTTPPSDPNLSSGSFSSLPPPPSRGPSPLRAPVSSTTPSPLAHPSPLASAGVPSSAPENPAPPTAPLRRPPPPSRTLPPRPPPG